MIRGNISEIKTLAAGHGTTSGVDADEADTLTEQNLEKMIPFIKDFSRRTGSVIAVTGGIDLVSDAKRCFVIRNGRPEMGRITGTGCQLSGMMTAFLAANPENNLEAAAAAVCAMGLAGETGWKYMQPGDGNATYRNRIIDAIYNMEGKELEEGANFEIRLVRYGSVCGNRPPLAEWRKPVQPGGKSAERWGYIYPAQGKKSG